MRAPLIVSAILFVPAVGFAEPPDPVEALKQIKAAYTKYEYRIPMRDGKRLFTAVYVPKDDSKQYPMLLTRTPYSCAPYGADKYPDKLRPGPHFSNAGYIFAYQDVRGRWNSEGEYSNMRPILAKKGDKDTDESTDTFDTVDWLVKNLKNHNGRVGQWGISYPGFYTVAGMIDAHPALVAVSPQAPVTDWFVGDDFHHNGALFLPHCFNFMANFGKPRPYPVTKNRAPSFDHETPDGYKFFLEMGPLANADAKFFKGEVGFWNDAMKHGTYDEFWKSRNIRQHIKNIRPAVLTVGGWFDAENLFGALETHKKVDSTGWPKGGHTLVMGPWNHGGWSRGEGDKLGDVHFNANTAEYFRDQIELPFFEHHLKDPEGEFKFPRAWVFETGTNVWRKHEAWPPKDAKATSFYMHPEGKLFAFEPSKTPVKDATTFEEFVSDPAKPVPYLNKTVIGMVTEYMTADQRFASQRPDVLVYQSPVFEEDTTVAGPLEVELSVSTTGSDADWVVKFIDVYPDDFPNPGPNPTEVKMGGYQQLIRGDVFRGKFRNSFEKPEPFKPGEVAKVKFAMPDSFHTFRPGHRMMVQVQSTWFPLVDRNPQTFTDIYSAKAEDFKKQTHRVHHTAEHPSRVTVGVLP